MKLDIFYFFILNVEFDEVFMYGFSFKFFIKFYLNQEVVMKVFIFLTVNAMFFLFSYTYNRLFYSI